MRRALRRGIGISSCWLFVPGAYSKTATSRRQNDLAVLAANMCIRNSYTDRRTDHLASSRPLLRPDSCPPLAMYPPPPSPSGLLPPREPQTRRSSGTRPSPPVSSTVSSTARPSRTDSTTTPPRRRSSSGNTGSRRRRRPGPRSRSRARTRVRPTVLTHVAAVFYRDATADFGSSA